jgi:hypothetical protein
MSAAASLPSPPDSDGDTVSLLERLSAAFCYIINEKDFTLSSSVSKELMEHISPDFRAQMDTVTAGSESITFDQQMAFWRQRAEEQPDVSFMPVHTSTELNEETGRATVYLNMEVRGIDNVKLEAINQLKWRRQGETWFCYYVIGMRGSAVNSGADVPPGMPG